MIGSLTAGALVGLGLFLVIRGLIPARPSLAAVLAQVSGVGEPVAIVATTSRWAARVGPGVARALERFNVDLGDLRADLAVLGRSVEDHMALRAAGAVAGVTGATALGLLATVVSFEPSLVLIGWMALGGALVGFALPDTIARRRALERRAGFRQALAFFLDVVVVVLAGGAGVSSALGQASEAGDGWAFLQIRTALARGRVRREPPWAVLGRLGAELRVPELEELAASVSLAESEGASVRESLKAKAASIRDHQLADIEALAASATVRMAAPLVLLGLAFSGFVLYGAVSSVFVG